MDTCRLILYVLAVPIILAGTPCGVCSAQTHTYGGLFNLPIPALDDPESQYGRGHMTDAIIEIPDHFIITDLDVAVTITHTSVCDLQIFLKRPGGTKLCLSLYNLNEFFLGANYTQTIFDDQALLPINQALPPFTGRFRPASGGCLSIFNGQDSFGPWHLMVYDTLFGNSGSLDGFQLMITNPEPATLLLLAFGACLVRLRRRNSTIITSR